MDWLTILTPSVPIPELIVRGTIIFLVLLLLLRVVGQRESGGLGITDVLLIVLVAEGAAVGLHGTATAIADGLILSATILFWSVVVDAVAYRFPRASRVLKSRPRVLIQDGQLNRKVMLREFMTIEEVASQMRLHGITDIGEVERAFIEPNGMISVVRRDHEETEPVEPPEGV
jgi:uncharacterized membrane protein YcaP (DUF421 family)